MRPPGEIRLALLDAISGGPGTSRELAQRAQVGLDAARATLDNMRRSDTIFVIDLARVEGVKQRVPVYGLRGQPGDDDERNATAQLASDLAGCWAEFV